MCLVNLCWRFPRTSCLRSRSWWRAPRPAVADHRRASQIALAAVLIVVGGSIVWWTKHRPSYLLYQAHSRLGMENQAAVITEYKRLLSQPSISKDDEIKYRKALGEFYVRAVQENTGVSYYFED